MNKVAQQDIDLWEAWIEFDESPSQNFGILYVVGETEASLSAPQYLLQKRASENNCLHLELIPQNAEKKKRNREVMYAEPISCIHCYDSVTIFFDGSIISKFEELEILI